MDETRTRFSRLLLVAMLVAFACLKAFYNPYPVSEFGPDAGYYYQMARHVMQGDGLLTSVSRAHQGINQLPFPTSEYPLWPLVLGGAGKLIGLERAAVWLPESLFLVSLFLLYYLANAIVCRLGNPSLLSAGGESLVDVGHVSVLIFGINAVYFKYTSLPFTEGLAFCLLFCALLALRRVAGPRPLLWSGVAGGLAALGYLTRYQFLGLVLAMPATLALAGIKEAKYRRAAIIAAVCAVGPVVLWVIHVATTYGQFTPMMLLDGTVLRQTPELEPSGFIIKTGSIGEFVSDRLWGTVYVAFNNSSSYSYVKSFRYVVYLAPAALLYLVLRPRMLVRAVKSSVRPDFIIVVWTVAAGLLLIAPAHAMHAYRFGGWFFQFRQGLPYILLLVVGLCFFLTRRPLLVRLATLGLIALSLWKSVTTFEAEFRKGRNYPAPVAARQEFGRWIDSQPVEPVFATTRAQVLGGQTEGLFHNVSCNESGVQMAAYFKHVGVTHLVTLAKEKECGFFSSIRDDLDLTATFGDSDALMQVWSPRQGLSGAIPPARETSARRPGVWTSISSLPPVWTSRASPLRIPTASAPSRTTWR